MEEESPSFLELICETHLSLDRQGPGAQEITLKALSFIGDLSENARVIDLGCGTGTQTMTLAEHISGSIVGLDLLPPFVDAFNSKAKALGLDDRVHGMAGSMDDLPFSKEEFDLMWCEGAIDSLGFEKGLRYWNNFLKPGAYVAVSSPSWFDSEHPEEVERLWIEAGSSGLDTVDHQIALLQQTGYAFVAAFALPEYCWIDNYFTPREAADRNLLNKYPGNETVAEFVESDQREVELYMQYKQHYGYVFYIGRKL